MFALVAVFKPSESVNRSEVASQRRLRFIRCKTALSVSIAANTPAKRSVDAKERQECIGAICIKGTARLIRLAKHGTRSRRMDR